MTITRISFALLLAVPLIGACNSGSQNTSASTTPASTPADQAQPQTVLGRVVDKGIQRARVEMATRNIEITDGINVDVDNNGRRYRIGHDDKSTLPKAEITPTGDLLISGKAQSISPAQRAMLLGYRQNIMAIAETGMAIGVKGADLAGKAMLEVASGFMHGDVDAAGKRIDAEGHKLEAEARKICTQLPPMLASQQQLAASLPAFKPYARMTQSDIDDCMKDDHKGVAVMSQ